MCDPQREMAERHGRMLNELAEVNLSAAKILHDRLAAAETNAEARDLGLALQRVSRSLRQTLLLEAKLAKDRWAAAREDAADAQAAREREVAARKGVVRHAVARIAYEACDSKEVADGLIEDLDDHLDGYARDPGFAADATDELIALICKDLGLALPASAAAVADAAVAAVA
ncbi:MAG: hypothetical protein JWP49_1193, partial [Phenylobacterium sp.]|nr:hypothetical protein [Phenylobacterium sp.]